MRNLLNHTLLCCMLLACLACEKDNEDGSKPNNNTPNEQEEHSYIYYTTTDNNEIALDAKLDFGAKIVSHDKDTEDESRFVIEFSGKLTSIPQQAFSQKRTLQSITLPEGITAINKGAFYYCSELTSVNLPSTLTALEYMAFNECKKLNEISLPNGLCRIGEHAFSECGFENIVIPGSVREIEEWAFGSCFKLKSVTIEEGVEYISKSMFNTCINLTDITIPSTITSIEDYGFFQCESMSNLPHFESVKNIGKGAFGHCYKLTEITIPSCVETIGLEAFTWCKNLKKVVIGSGVTTIKRGTFSVCPSLDDVTIGDSVKIIENGAFATTAISEITIPDSVEQISGAFSECHSLVKFKSSRASEDGRALIFDDGRLVALTVIGLKEYTTPKGVHTIDGYTLSSLYDDIEFTKLIISEGVTTIRENAILACQNLKTIELPSTLTSISSWAIGNNTDLWYIYLKATTPPTIEGSCSPIQPDKRCMIYVPKDSVSAYRSSEWGEYHNKWGNITGYDYDSEI